MAELIHEAEKAGWEPCEDSALVFADGLADKAGWTIQPSRVPLSIAQVRELVALTRT